MSLSEVKIKTLDIIDSAADLLDSSLSEFLLTCLKTCRYDSTTSDYNVEVYDIIVEVLLDIYGSTEEVLHQLVDVEHWGKWDRIDDYNKYIPSVRGPIKYTTYTYYTIGEMFSAALSGRFNSLGWDPSVVPNIDFLEVNSAESVKFILTHDIAFLNGDFIDGTKFGKKQLDMYIPIQMTKTDGGRKIPYPFRTFSAARFGKGLTWHCNYTWQNYFTDESDKCYGFFKLKDFIAKVKPEDLRIMNLIPKHVLEKYNMPIIEL